MWQILCDGCSSLRAQGGPHWRHAGNILHARQEQIARIITGEQHGSKRAEVRPKQRISEGRSAVASPCSLIAAPSLTVINPTCGYVGMYVWSTLEHLMTANVTRAMRRLQAYSLCSIVSRLLLVTSSLLSLSLSLSVSVSAPVALASATATATTPVPTRSHQRTTPRCAIVLRGFYTQHQCGSRSFAAFRHRRDQISADAHRTSPLSITAIAEATFLISLVHAHASLHCAIAFASLCISYRFRPRCFTSFTFEPDEEGCDRRR